MEILLTPAMKIILKFIAWALAFGVCFFLLDTRGILSVIAGSTLYLALINLADVK